MLRQIEVCIANEQTTPQAFKEAAITVQRFYRWRKEYSGLKMDEARPKLPWAAIQPSGLSGGLNDLHQCAREVILA